MKKKESFIIGGYPHEYDNQYKENNFKSTKAKVKEIIFLRKLNLIKFYMII